MRRLGRPRKTTRRKFTGRPNYVRVMNQSSLIYGDSKAFTLTAGSGSTAGTVSRFQQFEALQAPQHYKHNFQQQHRNRQGKHHGSRNDQAINSRCILQIQCKQFRHIFRTFHRDFSMPMVSCGQVSILLFFGQSTTGRIDMKQRTQRSLVIYSAPIRNR